MRVAIVGGGISGLALAERLAAEGAEPIVVEADGRIGGKVASFRKDGFVLEAGPNGFLDKPRAAELLRLRPEQEPLIGLTFGYPRRPRRPPAARRVDPGRALSGSTVPEVGSAATPPSVVLTRHST